MDVVLSRVVQYCTSDSSLPQVVIIRFSINYHNFPISTLIDWSIDLVTLWLWCCTVINWIISSVSCHPSTRSRSSRAAARRNGVGRDQFRLECNSRWEPPSENGKQQQQRHHRNTTKCPFDTHFNNLFRDPHKSQSPDKIWRDPRASPKLDKLLHIFIGSRGLRSKSKLKFIDGKCRLVFGGNTQ